MSTPSPDPSPQRPNLPTNPSANDGALTHAVSGGGLTLPNAGSMGALFAQALEDALNVPGLELLEIPLSPNRLFALVQAAQGGATNRG